MENKNYPQLKYKVEAKFKKPLDDRDWIATFIELRTMIDNLIKEIKENDPKDIDLAQQIEGWTQDLWFEE